MKATGSSTPNHFSSTPRAIQRVLTAVLVLCIALLVIESAADSDRIIATAVLASRADSLRIKIAGVEGKYDVVAVAKGEESISIA